MNERERPPAEEAWQLVERVSARARHIRIELRAPSEVRLIIPGHGARRQAYEFLESRREWIERRLQELRERAPASTPPGLRWDGSDTLPLFGRPHRVTLHVARLKRPRLRVGDEEIGLFVPPEWRQAPERLRAYCVHALRERARTEAETLLREESLRLGLRHSGLRIADQKTLWGSCTWDGRINLNWRLLMAPPEVFRYVVIHELCHLRWRSHGPRFWGLVARQMPDYDAHRQWLREHGASLQAVLRASTGEV